MRWALLLLFGSPSCAFLAGPLPPSNTRRHVLLMNEGTGSRKLGRRRGSSSEEIMRAAAARWAQNEEDATSEADDATDKADDDAVDEYRNQLASLLAEAKPPPTAGVANPLRGSRRRSQESESARQAVSEALARWVAAGGDRPPRPPEGDEEQAAAERLADEQRAALQAARDRQAAEEAARRQRAAQAQRTQALLQAPPAGLSASSVERARRLVAEAAQAEALGAEAEAAAAAALRAASEAASRARQARAAAEEALEELEQMEASSQMRASLQAWAERETSEG